MNVTLFGQRVFANVIKDLEIILDYLEGPKSEDNLRRRDTQRRQTQNGGVNVTMKAEIGAIQLQVKKCHQAPEAGGGEE